MVSFRLTGGTKSKGSAPIPHEYLKQRNEDWTQYAIRMSAIRPKENRRKYSQALSDWKVASDRFRQRFVGITFGQAAKMTEEELSNEAIKRSAELQAKPIHTYGLK